MLLGLPVVPFTDAPESVVLPEVVVVAPEVAVGDEAEDGLVVEVTLELAATVVDCAVPPALA